MAGQRFTVTSGEVASGTTTPQTILQILAATNQGVHVKRITIACKGTSPTDAPLLVEILRQTSGGTGGGTPTPRKLDDDNDDTIQTTAVSGPTGEPSDSGEVLWTDEVHPQARLQIVLPYGQWLTLHGGDRLGVRVTAGVDINVVVTMECEE